MVGAAAEGRAELEAATAAVAELIDAGARPRAAASVVGRLSGLPANGLYRAAVTQDERPAT